jgi:hypothetical protein
VASAPAVGLAQVDDHRQPPGLRPWSQQLRDGVTAGAASAGASRWRWPGPPDGHRCRAGLAAQRHAAVGETPPRESRFVVEHRLQFAAAALIRPGEIAATAEPLKQHLVPSRFFLAWCGGAAAIEFGRSPSASASAKAQLVLALRQLQACQIGLVARLDGRGLPPGLLMQLRWPSPQRFSLQELNPLTGTEALIKTQHW